jgi:hypothetical protein
MEIPKTYPVSIGDIEESLIHSKPTNPPNATLAYTGNVGIFAKDSIESFQHWGITELKQCLEAILGKKVKIVEQ